jgi:hypothetical protein
MRRQLELEIADGELADLTHGTVFHHAMRGVVTTGFEISLHYSLARQLDLLNEFTLALDHQRSYALIITVHDIELHRLSLVIRNPVATIEEEDAVDLGSRRVLLVVGKKKRLGLVPAAPGIQIGDAIEFAIAGGDVSVECLGTEQGAASGLRTTFLNADMRHLAIGIPFDFGDDYDMGATILVRWRRIDDITRLRGLRRRRQQRHALTKSRAMLFTDIPDAALQCVACVGRANLAVVTLGIAHLFMEVLGIEHTLRILDCSEEGLQEDVETNIPTDVFDARIRNPGVFLARLEITASLGHSLGYRCPFHSRHNAGVVDGFRLPRVYIPRTNRQGG